MDCMFVSPQNAYVKNLTPKVMVLGHGAFERRTGHEGGALMNEVSALRKKTQETLLFSFFAVCHVRRPGEDSHLQTRKWALTRHQI